MAGKNFASKSRKPTLSGMLKGADNVYMTNKNIVITKVKTVPDKYGGSSVISTKKYVPKTANTMAIVNREMGSVLKKTTSTSRTYPSKLREVKKSK